MKKRNEYQELSSFRDPSGFLFYRKGVLLRQINNSYKKNYNLLIKSGLYDKLTGKKLLIPHKEVDLKIKGQRQSYKIIKPKTLPFISYPYEWCFSQLKDAALLTLKIQKLSLKYGMALKDASAYNIQFLEGRPIFIDTLSFEKYIIGKPWVAYRQFCQHFLAPILLASKKDPRLNLFSKTFLDGIPLDLASSLLPKTTFFNFSTLSHIHLHARSQKLFSKRAVKSKRGLNLNSTLALLNSLENVIKKLKVMPSTTEWGDYYAETNYSSTAFLNKKNIVSKYLAIVKPKKTVWDIGANTGVFSRIANQHGFKVLSFDMDHLAVEKNYLRLKTNRDEKILPLVADFINPSPALGWVNKERQSLLQRGPTNCVMALALIHHLVISNNLPLENIAQFFHSICTWLIIEFVPKNDSNVKKMLASREDIFSDYSKNAFENTFLKYFTIKKTEEIKGSERTLYLMKKR